MIVVSDAGPLLYLGATGQIELLRTLFRVVLTPRTVWNEVVVAGAGRPGADAVAATGWIVVVDVPPDAAPVVTSTQLDAGEADALWVAVTRHADLFLCDDRAGRTAAQEVHIRVTGTLGLLVNAKEVGALPAIRPIVEEILRLGLRVSPDVVERVLERAGE